MYRVNKFCTHYLHFFAKLNFIFQLGDRNSDSYLNETELGMIMHSSSRGFARMKRIEAPSMAKIEQIVNSSFSHPEVRLDIRGEISFPDVVMLSTADDRLRHYLSNLDSSAGADIANLYKQQVCERSERALR